jgi:5-methylcytosine-specific restriction enzyme A
MLAPVRGTRWCEKHAADNYVTRARQKYDREERPPWHSWYGLVAWKRLVEITRHNPQHALCEWIENSVRCNQPTAEIDHIIPHRGNWQLFMNPKNLQGLCKRHHSMKTSREVRFAGNNKT